MNNRNRSLNGRASCWLIGGLSCFGLLALLCIGSILIFGPKIQDFSKNMQESAKDIEMVTKQIKAISNAIDRYKADNKGAYPPSLAKLAPKYIDAKELEPLESSTQQKITWVYTPPKPTDPDSVVILTHKPQIDMNIEMLGQKTMMKFEYKLQKDGELVQEQVQTTPTGVQRNRKSLP